MRAPLPANTARSEAIAIAPSAVAKRFAVCFYNISLYDIMKRDYRVTIQLKI